MKNRFHFDRGDGSGKRRNSLSDWLSRQNLSEDEAVNMLERELAQRKNIKLVKRCVKDAGLSAKGFISNDKLELYFNIYKGNKSFCYIFKGWQDPGFRVGEFIKIDKSIPEFKDKFYKIFKICSSNLISVGLSESSDRAVGMSLEIGIYSEGFNSGVLKNAAQTLVRALKDIYKAL